MSDTLTDFLRRSRERCEKALPQSMGLSSSEFVSGCDELEELFSACRYSLLSGGKCVRASLVYASADAISPNADMKLLDHVACTIEMIHTYSLVHDDLPAMDNDDLRRGKPTCHLAFDEATAILAGDALHSRAFEIIAEAPEIPAGRKVEMIRILAAAVGPRGMVGGQAMDIASANKSHDLKQLRAMHSLKTGALIRAALALGGGAVGGNQEQLAALDSYGCDIGLAFQVADDILDVEGDTAVLGKTQGKDAAANKSTYVKLMGLDGAKLEAQRLMLSAQSALEVFGHSAKNLRDLAEFIVTRHK